MRSNTTICETESSHYGASDGLGTCSEEQYMLIDFCQSLASSCNCISEPPDLIDETRQEAKLLMNLMLISVPSVNDEERGVSSDASSSDRSFTSDISISSTTKRDTFTFTCPSLSLESPALDSHLQFNDIAHEASEMSSSVDPCPFPLPAHLLGRSLKVDDRDALRLSADAMARNVLHSFQKALNWRIQAWMYTLSKKLVEYEGRMIASGATIEEIKALLNTPEATLVVALQKLLQERGVATESASTSFEVLPQRIELNEEDIQCHLFSGANTSRRSSIDGCTGSDEDASPASSCTLFDEVTPSTAHSGSTRNASLESYSYTVAHQLRFSCTVQLQTLAGFTEIAIVLPGLIAGCFVCSETDPSSEMKSVKVGLDTKILASMVEKACRTIVRSSVEKIISQPQEKEVSKNDKANDIPQDAVQPCGQQELHALSSPTGHIMNQGTSVFVTPRYISDDLKHNTPSGVLLPMPDDLDGKNEKPRRISPQPSSQNFMSTCSDGVSMTRLSRGTSILKRRSPPPFSIDDYPSTATNIGSNVYTSDPKRRLPLISPPAGHEYQTFYEVPENGPSLPMLVEVACRAMDVVDE
jgi:hypothetical protein